MNNKIALRLGSHQSMPLNRDKGALLEGFEAACLIDSVKQKFTSAQRTIVSQNKLFLLMNIKNVWLLLLF